jgi:DNA polymerase-1
MDYEFNVVDFETYAILPRPQYPPKPVGVAIRWAANGISEYMAFDHPTGGNNCTREEAIRALRFAYTLPVVFHNAKFDMEVAHAHLGLPYPKVWHDTLLLAYLQSPDEPSFALKTLTAKFLNMPPEQQDAVKAWILTNVQGANAKNFGAYIAYAPVYLVAPYAISDVDRTHKLFNFLRTPVQANMPVAYDRERRLLPHLVAAEKRGIRVDRDLLRTWQFDLNVALIKCDKEIKASLNAPNLNLDSDDELADALELEGLISHWETPDGIPFAATTNPQGIQEVNPFGVSNVSYAGPPLTRSMSKDALKRCCTNADIVQQLAYRNAAATMLRMFVDPWLEFSKEDGRLHTEWHQVRGQEKNGTRTGRIASARPNLANVPNPNEVPPPFGLPPLPSLRRALLPEEGHLWVSADYSQQELRITAHYEADQMQQAYKMNPKLDLHLFAQGVIKTQTGKDIPRKHVKNVAFASIYGAGLPKLARMMGVTEEEAYDIRQAYFTALPGLAKLIDAVKERTKDRGFVRSLGGRLLTVEPPKMIKGKLRSFDYKQTNKLIQGSAADMTKQAIVDYCEAGGSSTFLSQVYDEINISVPVDRAGEYAKMLRDCMVNAMPLDVPILVDVEVGLNWGEMVPWVFP